ncbi:hypothetical protein PRIC2_002894 [Phytophthora ramorum]
MKFAAIAITAIVVTANVAGARAGAEVAATNPSTAVTVRGARSGPERRLARRRRAHGNRREHRATCRRQRGLGGHGGQAPRRERRQPGWGVGGGYGGYGGWGLSGWGSWGGWGGFGPYRFGFRCGGVPGWAYPLNYWTRFGAGLYGGGCGLGMPFGGLYYC